MYKLTFDDKPEANTYVKWARGKGYLVEGPYRERLSKNVKKFDLNGKRKKFSFVVLRKRGAGREGGDIGYADIPEKGKKKRIKKGRSVAQAKAELRQRAIAQGVMKEETPKEVLIHGMLKDFPRRYKETQKKLAAKSAIHEKLMADAEKMPIGSKSPEVKAPKKIPERLIEDASKLPIGSRAPLEPKKQRGSPKGSGKKISSKLQPLAAEAAKYDKFDDFEKAFSHEIRHGRYYHVTDNPNFKIDPSTGPQDASSMAGKPVPAKGKLMITSDLDNWAAEYKGKRQYVAIIDMGEVPKEKYWQVNRGFGNEFWVDDPSRAKVIKVVPMTQAKVDSRLHHKALPSSKEKLKDFYEKAKPAKAEIPIQPEIKKVMTGAKPSIVTNPRDYWDTHLENNPLRKGGQDTDAGSFTSWMIEAAGDVLRESHKHKASYTDPSYIHEKLNRIGRELSSRDWTDPISAGEQERLAKTRKLLEDLPAKTHKDKVIKRLIEGTVKRDREQTSEALREVKQHLVEEKAIKQSIKERKRVPLKELRKYREVVKEEHEARKEAKAYKERVREYKERAEEADREEAKYWEEHKETPEQQSRDEEVEALKAEAEAYEKSGVVKESAA